MAKPIVPSLPVQGISICPLSGNQEQRARRLLRLATIAEGLRSAAAASPSDPALQSRLSAAGIACQQLVAYLRRQDQQPPLRRCDDCQLNLGRDVLRALGTCPRWGMVRAGVESRCVTFVAKTAEVSSHG